MVTRYFSRYSAPRINRKYPLKSASLSAIGVPTSPGSNVIAADAAVDALIAGTLEASSEANCDHHGHEHGEGESCGHGGCHHH